MARTILDIAKEAAERDATAPAPTVLFGTNDRVAKILRAAAKDTLREYLRSTRAQGLSEFQSTWVFALHPGRFAYPLPPDFLRMIPNTEHIGGWPLGIVGPVSPQLWSYWIASGYSSAGPHSWRIRNNTILIEPTPSAAELVTIEYISRYPVVSLVQNTDLVLTGDHPMIAEPFVPRDGYVTLAGLVQAEAEGTPNDFAFEAGEGFDKAQWPSEPFDVLKRLHPLSSAAPKPQVRRPEFRADTDLPAFDDDYPLSLGMTYRLRRALGLPYAEHVAEYEEELESKMAEDAGGPRAFRLGADHCDYEAYPLGDGRWLVT